MKLCFKHREKIYELDNDPNEGEILSEFNERMNVLEYQNDIEKKANSCVVCFFGAIGRQTLEEITIELKSKVSC